MWKYMVKVYGGSLLLATSFWPKTVKYAIENVASKEAFDSVHGGGAYLQIDFRLIVIPPNAI